MPKKKENKRRGIIPLWFRKWIEPSPHRNSGGSSSSMTRTIERSTRDGRCCGCAMCILFLFIIFGFGIGGGFIGGFTDDDGDGGADPETESYWQLTINIRLGGELAYSGSDFIEAVEGIVFTVDICKLDETIIETMLDVTEGAVRGSYYDYLEGYGLHIEIEQSDMMYFGAGHVISGTDNTIDIYHFGDVVASATIDWISNGAGMRYYG